MLLLPGGWVRAWGGWLQTNVEAGMRVGEHEGLAWHDGSATLFDDSFEHTVWNSGRQACRPSPAPPRAMQSSHNHTHSQYEPTLAAV